MSTTERQPPRAPVFASIAERIRELALAEGLEAGDRVPAGQKRSESGRRASPR